jgi:hypothetical protein
MSYGSNVTSVEELIDLEDIQRNERNIGQVHASLERNPYNDGDMAYNEGYHSMGSASPSGYNENPYPTEMPGRSFGGGVPLVPQAHRQSSPYAKSESQSPLSSASNGSEDEIKCLDVIRHIDTCPLCRRYYNPSSVGYIIAIIVLCIIIFILAKYVIEKMCETKN